MCLILFAYEAHSKYSLILGVNRDEYYARPTLQANFWEEAPNVLAGKDLVETGTWLGVTRQGRLAALTNYRDPFSIKENARSRGLLVRDYLCSLEEPSEYLTRVHKEREEYNGFNLLLLNNNYLWYYSNREGQVQQVAPGVHGLSNHLLNTPWPKVVGGKQALLELVDRREEVMVDGLFDLLANRRQAKDEELPSTGVSLEWERILLPVFIQSEDYGTRSSTVILIDRCGHVLFCERTFIKGSRQTVSDVVYEFNFVKQRNFG